MFCRRVKGCSFTRADLFRVVPSATAEALQWSGRNRDIATAPAALVSFRTLVCSWCPYGHGVALFRCCRQRWQRCPVAIAVVTGWLTVATVSLIAQRVTANVLPASKVAFLGDLFQVVPWLYRRGADSRVEPRVSLLLRRR